MKKLMLLAALAASLPAQAETFFGCEFNHINMSARAIVVNENGAFYRETRDSPTIAAGTLQVKQHDSAASYVVGAYVDSKHIDYLQWRIFKTPDGWRVIEVGFDINDDNVPVIQHSFNTEAKCSPIYVES